MEVPVLFVEEKKGPAISGEKKKNAAAQKREREKKKALKVATLSVSTTPGTEQKSAPKKTNTTIIALKKALEETKARELRLLEEAKLAEARARAEEAEQKAQQEREALAKAAEVARKAEIKRLAVEKAKKTGTYLTPSQRQKAMAGRKRLELGGTPTSITTMASPPVVREDGKGEGKEELKVPTIRSPICCILGHVDSGKTKLLDKIRGTNVQAKEAGSITQQISTTFVPAEMLRDHVANVVHLEKSEIIIPGILLIDTPGHEVFVNLRTRGVDFCDLAIVVIDIMHSLKPQTIEVLTMLRERKIPFVVALTKVDLLYGWLTTKAKSTNTFQEQLSKQKPDVVLEFKSRVQGVIADLAAQGFNACLHYDNRDLRSYVSIIPVSSLTGQGLPDFLMFVTMLAQTRLKLCAIKGVEETGVTGVSSTVTEAAVLEVKMLEGLGHVIDVILVNGTLCKGDQIVVAGWDAPVVTTVRNLLTSPVSQEGKGAREYVHHERLEAAKAITIVAPHLEGCVAGSSLLVVNRETKDVGEIEKIKEQVQKEIQSVRSRLTRDGKGVWVQASTLGSLEALVSLLGSSENGNISVMGVGIGPLQKKHVMAAAATEQPVILAFNVKIAAEVHKMAKEAGVCVFEADVIYHLVDQATKHMATLKAERQTAALTIGSLGQAVFPCIVKILDEKSVFRKQDPLLIGVRVVEGVVKIGTPLCALPELRSWPPSSSSSAQRFVELGRVVGIQNNHEDVKEAKKDTEVCLKISLDSGTGASTSSASASVCYGRHFDWRDQIVSKLTRESIDTLKANFKEEVGTEGWKLVIKLKTIFSITN